MQLFAAHGICFEICLSANNRIGVPADIVNEHPDHRAHSKDDTVQVTLDRPLQRYFQQLPQHPLPQLMATGIPICLGSDNPLLMNTNIGKEYALARKYANCSVADCLQFTRNALRYANVDKITAQRLQGLVDNYAKLLASGEYPTATVLGYSEAFPQIKARNERSSI